MPSTSISRRRLLAASGGGLSAALAGCGALPWTDDEPTFTPTDADAVLTDATPEIERPVPVVPTSDALEAELERVDTLLADVPNSIERHAVSDDTARRIIGARRDEARDARNEAATATGDDRYRALRTTREARDAARAATTAHDAATTDGTDPETIVANLREERDEGYADARDRLDSIAYRGDDTDDGLFRAALFRAHQESDLRGAVARLERDRWSVDDEAADEIGDDAGALEFAAATETAWTHLEDRFDEQMDDPTDLTSGFDAAFEAFAERVESTHVPHYVDEDWPDAVVDGTLDDESLRGLLWQAVEPVWDPKNALEAAIARANTAVGLYEGVRFEARYRAFRDVRDRIDEGTVGVAESADEIRAERTAAIEAATSAPGLLTRPSIGAYVLAETLQSLAETDEWVREAANDDSGREFSLQTEYGDYARLRAQLEALPDVVESFRERLRSA